MTAQQKVNTEDVVIYRKKNPCLTGASIARKFNISRERVRQILSEEGLSNASNHYGSVVHCPKCGKPGNFNRPGSMCRKCYHEAHTVTLVCQVCGKTFERGQSHLLHAVQTYKTGLFFCSHLCQGKYFSNCKVFHRPRRSIKEIQEGVPMRTRPTETHD